MKPLLEVEVTQIGFPKDARRAAVIVRKRRVALAKISGRLGKFRKVQECLAGRMVAR
jgi:hypothetical protein